MRITNKADIMRSALLKFRIGRISVARPAVFRTTAAAFVLLASSISAGSRNHIGTSDTLAIIIICTNDRPLVANNSWRQLHWPVHMTVVAYENKPAAILGVTVNSVS